MNNQHLYYFCYTFLQDSGPTLSLPSQGFPPRSKVTSLRCVDSVCGLGVGTVGTRCWDHGDSVLGLGVGTRCGDSVLGLGDGIVGTRCGDAVPVFGVGTRRCRDSSEHIRTCQDVSVCVRMCQCVQIMCQNESDSINKDKLLFQNTYSALTIQCRL